MAVAAAAQWEIKKLHQRIDAIILLLKRRGIDIFERPDDPYF